jgi:CRISPR system Cascade subunit CasA
VGVGVAQQASFNLLHSPWLPFRRQSGKVEWATPDALTRDLTDDPVVGFAWGRADFDAAAEEFIIGLLTTAMAPQDDKGWRSLWRTPPHPDELSKRWQFLTSHFDLDGPKSRLLQDQDELADAEEKDIAGLLIDAPGDKTIRDNTDHFVKRGQVPVLSRAAAAMALFTLQAYAPSGGVGHRTSLRGGGPLTTLVEDPKRPTLWHRSWLAVEDQHSIHNRNAASHLPPEPHHIFPWTAPTRTSDPKAGGRATTSADVHALQVYWGMPRRIRLQFEPAKGRACGLTGQLDEVVVRAFRTRNYGTNYTSGFRHPLTPHYRANEDQLWLPVHGQPGGIGYRHWLGLLVASNDRLREPALAVGTALRRRVGSTDLRLAAHGYDMDNMKARGFASGAMPIVGLADEDRRELIRRLAEALILATEQTVRLLLGSLKAALFSNPSEARGDLSFHGERLWRQTESAFYAALVNASSVDPQIEDTDRPLRVGWRTTLQKEAVLIFDEVADLDALDIVDLARVVGARRNLLSGLRGYGKGGQALFRAIRIPVPEERPKRRKGGGVAGEEARP